MFFALAGASQDGLYRAAWLTVKPSRVTSPMPSCQPSLPAPSPSAGCSCGCRLTSRCVSSRPCAWPHGAVQWPWSRRDWLGFVYGSELSFVCKCHSIAHRTFGMLHRLCCVSPTDLVTMWQDAHAGDAHGHQPGHGTFPGNRSCSACL